NMPGIVTVQRTMKSVSSSTLSLHLEAKAPHDVKITVPNSITLAPGASATFDITVDASDVPLGETRFGRIEIGGIGGGNKLTFPVTLVRGTGPVPLTKTGAPAPFAVNTNTTRTLAISNPEFPAHNASPPAP